MEYQSLKKFIIFSQQMRFMQYINHLFGRIYSDIVYDQLNNQFFEQN